jgi:outer membrane murein-binding lipoprotein Lpp
MTDTARDSSTTRSRTERTERIKELEATVRRLRARVSELESDREHLLEENQALRKKVTHAHLADTLLATLEEEDGDAAPAPEAPSAATGLHRALPSSFTFQTFFRVAEQEGLDTADARRCLRHLLDRGRLARDGSRLTKQEATSDAQ